MVSLKTIDRATSSDRIFDDLYGKIVRLELLPGTKLSETDVARTYDVSRQPVREAFTQLAKLNLLLVRPQRATIVRPFSRELIANARFTRKAIELEVVRTAADARDQSVDAEIDSNMKAQRTAIDAADATAFHALDYEFHRLLCLSADRAFAFDIIAANKAQVDRLCMLSLTSTESMEQLYADHQGLVAAIKGRDSMIAETYLRAHLDRLSPTIDAIYTTHRSYFD